MDKCMIACESDSFHFSWTQHSALVRVNQTGFPEPESIRLRVRVACSRVPETRHPSPNKHRAEAAWIIWNHKIYPTKSVQINQPNNQKIFQKTRHSEHEYPNPTNAVVWHTKRRIEQPQLINPNTIFWTSFKTLRVRMTKRPTAQIVKALNKIFFD